MKSIQKRFTPGQFIGALATLFLGIVTVAYAVTLPFPLFTAGSTISASQVNANFAALDTAVDALEAKVNTIVGTNLPLASKQGKMGYALINLGNSTSNTPDRTFSFNSSGGDIMALHLGVGSYGIIFDGLGAGAASGGHVQVSAYGSAGTATCHTSGWDTASLNATINVLCQDFAGAAVDSQFNVLFVL